jgi:virginiamycin B lyase
MGSVPTLRRFLLGAMLLLTLAPAASATAAKPAPVLKNAWTRTLPQYFQGNSVAIGPGGAPAFGLYTESGSGPSIVRVTATGKPKIEEVRKEEEASAATSSVTFDPRGDLWFVIDRAEREGLSIARLSPGGGLAEFKLPGDETVTALTIGPEDDAWFTRVGEGEVPAAKVGRVTPVGELTEFPLEAGSRPASITTGPDGALWFTEEAAGRIGRITTRGEVQLFQLDPKVEPRQIVTGADGALWFSENAQERRYGRVSDRIGRITTEGQMMQFPVPFGEGTWSIAADPRGVVWFTTTEGEFSSISPSGNVGPRGCARSCGDPIEGLALAPNGALWFAAGHKPCRACGGVSGLMYGSLGTTIGKLRPGALEPADPDGPPAIDPYAAGQPKPPPPIAHTGKALEVESGYADLTGFIDSRSFPTTWLFKWGRTKRYGHRGFFPEDPFRAHQESAKPDQEIFGLCPDTTYHYEIVAYGPGGKTPGGDRTFRTLPGKHPPKHCRAR